MILTGSYNMSDDSEDEMENDEVDIYRRKYQLLMERCEVLQQDNERVVNTIHKSKKLLRRMRKHRQALMNRLDMHSDTWRNMALQILLDKPQCYNLTTPHAVKQEKNNIKTLVGSRASSGEKVSRKNSVGGASSAKKKGSKLSEKAEKDPNAPKRPANPFFQFCQEQRPIVMERLGSESKTGEQDACKIELTKQLASQWKTLTPEDKKVYYDMYEKSKEKYAMEMQIYTNRGKPDDNPS